jgi:hypothetical protein
VAQSPWYDAGMVSRLETVDLDSRPLHAVLDEESRDLCTLVALELDNLTHLLVVYKSAVAGELFLECFQKLLLVILCKKT